MGYRMPAEWQEHAATWLAWPKDPTTFPGKIIEKVEDIYLEMIRALTKGERVNLLVDDFETARRLSKRLPQTRNLSLERIPTADVWIRDYGPIFVKNRGIAATKWIFNAWGDKYEDLKRDDEAGRRVADSTGVRVFEPGIVLEGGSVDVNGRGTCITTEQCLLNRNRNRQLAREDIERYLREYLGVAHVIWLKNGIAGDDTDGHVDDIARFVNETTVVCMIEADSTDENFESLQTNVKILSQARDQDGKKITVVPIQMPERVDSADGRLPASYANFYVGNEVVLVPTYGGSTDRAALEAIRPWFPEREVIGINCDALVHGLGAIHCITQQQPAAT